MTLARSCTVLPSCVANTLKNMLPSSAEYLEVRQMEASATVSMIRMFFTTCDGGIDRDLWISDPLRPRPEVMFESAASAVF